MFDHDTHCTWRRWNRNDPPRASPWTSGKKKPRVETRGNHETLESVHHADSSYDSSQSEIIDRPNVDAATDGADQMIRRIERQLAAAVGIKVDRRRLIEQIGDRTMEGPLLAKLVAHRQIGIEESADAAELLRYAAAREFAADQGTEIASRQSLGRIGQVEAADPIESRGDLPWSLEIGRASCRERV